MLPTPQQLLNTQNWLVIAIAQLLVNRNACSGRGVQKGMNWIWLGWHGTEILSTCSQGLQLFEDLLVEKGLRPSTKSASANPLKSPAAPETDWAEPVDLPMVASDRLSTTGHVSVTWLLRITALALLLLLRVLSLVSLLVLVVVLLSVLSLLSLVVVLLLVVAAAAVVVAAVAIVFARPGRQERSGTRGHRHQGGGHQQVLVTGVIV